MKRHRKVPLEDFCLDPLTDERFAQVTEELPEPEPVIKQRLVNRSQSKKFDFENQKLFRYFLS